MSLSCTACKQDIGLGDLLHCTACKDAYHYACLNITSAQFRENNITLIKTYRCYECSNVNTRKRRSDNTPIRKELDMSCDEISNSLPEQQGPPPLCGLAAEPVIGLSQFHRVLEQKLDAKFTAFKTSLSTELVANTKNLIDALKQEFRNSITSVTGKIQELNTKFDTLDARVAKLEEDRDRLQVELSNRSAIDTSGLQEAIVQLRSDLNDKEQVMLLNDVEISGVPEADAESCMHLVTAVATKLGVSLERNDVVSVTRVGMRRPPSAAGTAALPRPRPRPIVVRLARRTLRDDFLKSARVRRGATTADLGLPPHEPQRIYVNERLTKCNRILFGSTREAARKQGWRFVWTREGRVCARRDESSPMFQIRSETDYNRVFNINNISSK